MCQKHISVISVFVNCLVLYNVHRRHVIVYKRRSARLYTRKYRTPYHGKFVKFRENDHPHSPSFPLNTTPPTFNHIFSILSIIQMLSGPIPRIYWPLPAVISACFLSRKGQSYPDHLCNMSRARKGCFWCAKARGNVRPGGMGCPRLVKHVYFFKS